MLRPLLYLSALTTLAGAQQTFKASSEFDISSCPITIYGQTYQHVYVNLTSKNLVVCFNSFYSPGTKDDCIFGPLTDSDSAEFEKYQRIPILETIVKYSVPTIKTRMDCYFSFSYQHNKGYATLALINFGPQTVLYLYSPAEGTVVVDVQVDGTSADQVEVTNTPTSRQTRGYLDISGCRHSGAVYKPATQVNSPETCFSLTCDEDVVLKTSSCGPLERCLGNSSCIPAVLYDSIFNPKLDLVCTVTGPTLIDFQGHVTSVKDRCTYSLLSIPSVPGLQVLANFQERRRKDVSFLDSVTLWLDRLGVHIHLKQGGRVLVDNSTLTLSSSAQMVHGVELSQDLTGVTAKLSLSNFTVSVFFDGYTVQIHLQGPIGSALHGLCENSSRSLTELKLSESSSTSCEMQYTDINDSVINCTRMTEYCNFLKEAPFSSCDIDPEPYITACTDTLCKYPDLDGLKCQFLEAYAKTCRLKHNATLDGWRSKSECLNPEAFCKDRTCSDHEFCGEKTAGGDTRCFCRAIYASKYKDRNTLGDPTVCNQNSASLTLVNCLLVDAGVDYTVLHLKDLTCRGHMDKERHMVTFSFNSTNQCGSEVTSNNNQIIYQNTISNDDGFSNVITRRDQVFIDFSCIYLQEATKAFKIRSSSVIKVITSAVWNDTLTMKAYTDAARTQPVESNTEVWLDQKIWVELKIDGLDGDLISMVTKSCWATNQESDNGSLRYELIKNGCANPADPTVMVEGNGEGTSNYFSFNMFQFSGRSGNIFLHCKLQLCVKEGNSCIPKCNGARRRRSLRPRNEAPALISMVWTN
ncbi:alpha-tectorin-like [Girardinichthys multiradiatus]|uniref:alpha-tectorin-like n=1 Tax=Girardinichthys multiradiatus TaxID=208333 RepID=UPI001FAC81E0|nr:alpha-tectorin-like [Girardinichthys multiradiatus]XP_047241749.1 alpha-tectorin-like [Girardinichthys multiradiatus]XP_047241750.1 alpha-tectorin-like [Girardinichthys multiradiatus]XP_047241751.1 alpha-tectorin-like [Girardinichthys multiradiatus]